MAPRLPAKIIIEHVKALYGEGQAGQKVGGQECGRLRTCGHNCSAHNDPFPFRAALEDQSGDSASFTRKTRRENLTLATCQFGIPEFTALRNSI